METVVGTLSKAGSIHKLAGGYVGLPPIAEPGRSLRAATPCTTSEPLVDTYTYT